MIPYVPFYPYIFPYNILPVSILYPPAVEASLSYVSFTPITYAPPESGIIDYGN